MLDELKPHLIVLTEHDVKDNAIDRINVENFKIDAHFSRTNSNKGGVMILRKNNIGLQHASLKHLHHLQEEKQFECCASMYTFDKIKFILVGLYRSPSSSIKVFLEKLSKLIKILSKKCSTGCLPVSINKNP